MFESVHFTDVYHYPFIFYILNVKFANENSCIPEIAESKSFHLTDF